jgi:YidC/Oxa1 family membrane protein insertase
MLALFHSFIYQPLYNALIMLYNFIPGHDFGISIIVITVLLKGLLWPLSKKQIESQKKMQELQPRLKAVQEKYKHDKEKQTKAVMEFYKNNKANPFSGCLPLIAQLVFLIAIYRVLFSIAGNGLNVDSSLLYHFVSNPGKINDLFLGIINLSKPNIFLAIFAAAAQFYQTKMLMAKQAKKKEGEKKDKDEPDFAQIMNKQMLYLGPMLTLFIGIRFAAGLALYWLVSTLFMIGQQWYIERMEFKAKKQS